MSDLGLRFNFKEVGRLEAALRRVEKLPQKVVTKAAQRGAAVTRQKIRGKVPVDTGALKRGIVRKAEKSRRRGKKVYQLTFDAGMNDIFQKPVKNPGAAGSKTTKGGHAYYPASQEYGYLTRRKGGGLSYVPGLRFMREGAGEAEATAELTMIRTVTAELEKEWRKK